MKTYINPYKFITECEGKKSKAILRKNLAKGKNYFYEQAIQLTKEKKEHVTLYIYERSKEKNEKGKFTWTKIEEITFAYHPENQIA